MQAKVKSKFMASGGAALAEVAELHQIYSSNEFTVCKYWSNEMAARSERTGTAYKSALGLPVPSEEWTFLAILPSLTITFYFISSIGTSEPRKVLIRSKSKTELPDYDWPAYNCFLLQIEVNCMAPPEERNCPRRSRRLLLGCGDRIWWRETSHPVAAWKARRSIAIWAWEQKGHFRPTRAGDAFRMRSISRQ